MSSNVKISAEEIDKLYARLKKEAEEAGYRLNPDESFTKDLVRGLIVNERRYGYWACPCRLASGDKTADLDIVCPCDYRDADLDNFGTCYCGLYVSDEVHQGKRKLTSIPERRPPSEDRAKITSSQVAEGTARLPLPVWRCKVCGYLCARDRPPEICPICKARQERFERFI